MPPLLGGGAFLDGFFFFCPWQCGQSHLPPPHRGSAAPAGLLASKNAVAAATNAERKENMSANLPQRPGPANDPHHLRQIAAHRRFHGAASHSKNFRHKLDRFSVLVI